MYGYLYLVLLYIFYVIKFLLDEKYRMIQVIKD